VARVTLVNAALSDRGGYADLNRSLNGFDGEKFCAERVELIEWDKYAPDRGLVGRVTMMKIDVEGWEARVLAD
jgi:FkbM family methyltransferase